MQLNYIWTSALSFVFLAALSISICGAFVWSLRRAVPLVVSVVTTYVVTAVTFSAGLDAEYLVGLVLIACVAILSGEFDHPPPRWMWIALGAMFVVAGLIKVSLFPSIGLLLVVTVLCLQSGRSRALIGLGAGALMTFSLTWFASGNTFANLIPFAKTSMALISGYASALSLEEAGRVHIYWYAAIVATLILAAAWSSQRGASRRTTVGIMLLAAVAVWVVFKEGFVRHDHYHDPIFFAVAPLLLVAFLPRRRAWILVPGTLLLTGLYALSASGYATLLPRPDRSVHGLLSQATTLSSPSHSATVIEKSRESLRRTYDIPTNMLQMMRGHTADVSPFEQTIIWAYPQIHFDPLPVIQDYTAYTPSLDQADATYLASDAAPTFILRETRVSLDGTDPAFEPPQAQLTIECRYHQVAGNLSWQLLERGADRCGAMKSLGVVTSRFDSWIPVPAPPAPGDAVVARFQISLGLLSAVESAAFKPKTAYVAYNFNPLESYRFVIGTSEEPHILRDASTLGYFSVFGQVPVSSLQFFFAGDTRTTQKVKVSFFAIPVAPAGGGNGEVLPTIRTTLTQPVSGTQLSGGVWLRANTSYTLPTTSVTFYLTDSSHRRHTLGTGIRTYEGWMFKWNTSTVANGIYTLQSFAEEQDGNAAWSKGTTVTVTNR